MDSMAAVLSASELDLQTSTVRDRSYTLRSALFWNFKQSGIVVPCRCFGLSRNVGMEPQFYTLKNHKRGQISFTSRRKFEITLALQSSSWIAVPIQAWSGPKGSRKLRFLDYMATAQDGGKVVSLTHRPPFPTPRKYSWYSFC